MRIAKAKCTLIITNSNKNRTHRTFVNYSDLQIPSGSLEILEILTMYQINFRHKVDKTVSENPAQDFLTELLLFQLKPHFA